MKFLLSSLGWSRGSPSRLQLSALTSEISSSNPPKERPLQGQISWLHPDPLLPLKPFSVLDQQEQPTQKKNVDHHPGRERVNGVRSPTGNRKGLGLCLPFQERGPKNLPWPHKGKLQLLASIQGPLFLVPNHTAGFLPTDSLPQHRATWIHMRMGIPMGSF